jgi:hypothetical protein
LTVATPVPTTRPSASATSGKHVECSTAHSKKTDRSLQPPSRISCVASAMSAASIGRIVAVVVGTTARYRLQEIPGVIQRVSAD